MHKDEAGCEVRPTTAAPSSTSQPSTTSAPSSTTLRTTTSGPSSTTPVTTTSQPSSTTPWTTTSAPSSTTISSTTQWTTTAPTTITTSSTPSGGEDDDPCKTQCHVPHWRHETDCDKFWRCEGNQKVLGTCSEGLHFNVNTQTCDFMCNVDCVREEVQSTAERDGLKLFVPWDKVDEIIEMTNKGEKSSNYFGEILNHI